MLKNSNLLLSLYLFTRTAALVVFFNEILCTDHVFWIEVIKAWTRGENPYASTPFLNWPPLWLGILVSLNFVSSLFKIDFVFLIRFFLVLIEALLIIISYKFLVKKFGKESIINLFLVYILCPVPLILVTIHCNFDVLVGLFIFLSLSFLVSFQSTLKPNDWLKSCAFLGLGILTKTIPIILVPLLLSSISHLKLRTIFIGGLLLVLPTFLSISYLYHLSPQATVDNILRYRSTPGYYGVTGLLFLFDLKRYLPIYTSFFLGALVLSSVSASYYFARSKKIQPEKLYLYTGMILLILTNFGTGYGPQYAYWFLPLLVVIMAVASRDLLIICYFWLGIVSITYLIEYSFLNTHGNLLARYTTWNISNFSIKWSTQSGQTLIRMPQFCISVILLYFLSKDLLQRQTKTIVN